MRVYISAALLTFSLSACGAFNWHERVTSGIIGCPETEMVLTNESTGIASDTWTATCRGKTFHCVYMRGGTSCAPELPKNP